MRRQLPSPSVGAGPRLLEIALQVARQSVQVLYEPVVAYALVQNCTVDGLTWRPLHLLCTCRANMMKAQLLCFGSMLSACDTLHRRFGIP